MTLLTVNAMSQSLMRTVTFNVYLPSDKVDMAGNLIAKPPYKTLYLLHGIIGDQNDWLVGTRIASVAKHHNLAVVMPAGENQFYLDQPDHMTNYSQFIGQELLDLTRNMFPLSHKREDTYIAGLSMGGYGALHNGLKYYDNFCAIGAFSSGLILEEAIASTDDSPVPFQRRDYYQAIFGDLSKVLDSDKNPTYQAQQLSKSSAAIPQMYITCGTEDSLLQANQKFVDSLVENKVAHTFETWTGGHEWAFWDKSVEKFINWLGLEDDHSGVSSDNIKG